MIQMIEGKYGLYTDGKVIGMTRESGPFSIDAEREAELVAAGIAEYVYDSSGAPIGFDEQPPEVETGKPLEDMSVKELREIGKSLGYTFKVGMKKAAMVDCIKHGPPDAEAPDTEDSESAPTFDATEAVQ